MSFLLDTNICSAHFRKPGKLDHRFVQYSGQLFIPTIVLGELLAWYHHRSVPKLLQFIYDDLLSDVWVLSFDETCAEFYGEVRGQLLKKGIAIKEADLMIASVALAYDFTLVTHNTADFVNISGLRLDDWLIP
jgi:tRNA(fMet)-specific endonuclease VapC